MTLLEKMERCEAALVKAQLAFRRSFRRLQLSSRRAGKCAKDIDRLEKRLEGLQAEVERQLTEGTGGGAIPE